MGNGIEPLEASRTGDLACWTAPRVASWTWTFVALGVALRVVRYALKYPLWGDEAFLASNLIDRDFAGLMRPLDFTQVCPLLFLWVEKAAVLAFGFSEWSLRLVPTLASIAGLFLFRHVAGRIVRGPALILAVGILAVGYVPIRHGGEVKPYATDFLIALALWGLAVEWLRAPDRNGWLWVLAGFGPIAVVGSHPAIFVAATVGLVLLVPVARKRRASAYLPFALFGVATVATFVVLLRAVTSSQSDSVMDVMSAYWAGAFPPRGLGPLLQWLASVHTSHMFAYPAGGESGASTLTTGCAVAAIVATWRRGSRSVLALWLAPFGFGLVAAWLGRYPYGGSARVMQYVAPAICLMAGLGAAALLSKWPRPWPTFAAMAAMILTGLGSMAWDVSHPYKSEFDVPSRDFARKFWSQEAGSEIACARIDFGVKLDPKGWRNDRSALYLCHQAIYSPRRRRREPVRVDRVGPSRPLRCVVFQERTTDAPGIAAWLAEMESRFTLRSRAETFVNRGARSPRGSFEDRYMVYEFIPRELAGRRPDDSRR